MPTVLRGNDDFDSAFEQGLGDGQTWVQVTRDASVTYTNSTGRPILFAGRLGGGQNATFTVQGENFIQTNVAGMSSWLFIVIPDGETYSYTGDTLSVRELR